MAALRRTPYLPAIDDVLPKNVAAGTYGGEWREISAGYPDGEGCVLLTQSLTRIDRNTEASANGTTATELEEAEHEGEESYEEEEGDGGLGVKDVLHSGARDNEQGAAPEIIRKILYGDDATAEAVHVMLDDVGKQHRDDQHREHLI